MNGDASGANRTWDLLCHLSALAMLVGVPFGNILGPLIVWLIKRNELPSVDAHGKESLNFQISVTLYLLGFAALTFGLTVVLVGFLLVPILIVAAIVGPIVDVVFIIIATIKANNGELYRYPFTLRLIH